MQKQDPDAVSIRFARQNQSVTSWNIHALFTHVAVAGKGVNRKRYVASLEKKQEFGFGKAWDKALFNTTNSGI